VTCNDLSVQIPQLTTVCFKTHRTLIEIKTVINVMKIEDLNWPNQLGFACFSFSKEKSKF